MQSVLLGETGIEVSRLSFGTAFLGPLSDHLSPEEGAALLLQALDQGVSFWDTSDDYGTHPHVACALQHVAREQVVLASKLREPGASIDRALDELGTDYLDILLVHEVTWAGADAAREMLRAWQREKALGKVRALGFSTHSVQVARLAAGWPEVEVLLLPLNATGVCTSDSSLEDGTVDEVHDAAQQAWRKGKGIVAMKVMGCGALANDPGAAISFVARLLYTHSLCIGMRCLCEVQENIRLLDSACAGIAV